MASIANAIRQQRNTKKKYKSKRDFCAALQISLTDMNKCLRDMVLMIIIIIRFIYSKFETAIAKLVSSFALFVVAQMEILLSTLQFEINFMRLTLR